MNQPSYQQQSQELIDGLKAVCAGAGLGNDGNEYRIIVQTFLYKLLSDKFAFELKRLEPRLAEAGADWISVWHAMPATERELLEMQLDGDVPRLTEDQLVPSLFNRLNQPGFAALFDDALVAIAAQNHKIFAVRTDDGEKVALFDRLSDYVTGSADKKDKFCRALMNRLASFSFERLFEQRYDFYATLFEYLIKDYNKDNGGEYAEYYTPHAVATVMADILVPEDQRGKVRGVTCYDPAAGSGTLLMALAHGIGESNCSIFAQDMSQKSSSLLRLNLVLNKLVHSIPNVVQGNTILHPVHKEEVAPSQIRKFDYIVSNPPFKMDFSDYRNDLEAEANNGRFFAGIPAIPKKNKKGMAIYLLFIQHVLASLGPNGKAAIVVPTGFITAAHGIEKKIRQELVNKKMIVGVVSMPSNIFATTGTNVSILFIDKASREDVVLVDASALGTKVKEGKNQKTLLSPEEERHIVSTFNARETLEDFSIAVGHDAIKAKNYSLSAGQHFDVKIAYEEITPEDFSENVCARLARLESMFAESRVLEVEIRRALNGLSV